MKVYTLEIEYDENDFDRFQTNRYLESVFLSRQEAEEYTKESHLYYATRFYIEEWEL